MISEDAAAPEQAPDRVSRRRYERERAAREQAESLLEAKSRELFDANERLKRQAQLLEATVRERTAELDRARIAAEAASEAKSTFLATMSHEIRTPLNGLLGMAAALGDTPLDAHQRGTLDVVMTSGNLLLTVINDILDFSKIEAGRLELEEVPFQLTDLMTSVEAVHRLRAEDKGLRFAMAMPTETPRSFRGDPTRIRQILENLLSNAIKFTSKGHVEVSVGVAPEQGDRARLSFVVSDTGIGIADEKRDRLFRPFSQADPSTTRYHGGTGLGLSISKSLAAMMGGEIVVESTLGEGSVFRFIVTLEQKSDTGAPSPAAGEAATPPEIPSGLRILAAEDNKTNQLVLRHIVSKLHAELTIAETGREVIDLWGRMTPDLLLMDVHMPEMDGVEATREIRRRERALSRPATPIIALTANAMSHDVRSYLEAGMDDHLSKPVRQRDLERVIEKTLARAEPDAHTTLDSSSAAAS